MLEQLPRRLRRDLVVVHRLHFPLPVSYLAEALWGACFAVASVRQLLGWPVLCVIIANVLLILGPLAFNVALDLEIDTRHQEKDYLADAAKHFGGNGLVIFSIAEMGAGVLLAAAAGAVLARPLVCLVAVGIVLTHVLYNVEPLRLKRRGMTGALVFGLGATTGPALLTYVALAPAVPPAVWLVFAGLGLMAGGRTAWWSLPDRAADLAVGQHTPSARYGLRGAAIRADLLMAVGLLLLGWGLWWRFGPAWAALGLAGYAVFLADVVRTPQTSARRMLRRALPVIAVADAVLVVLALAAG